MRRVAVFAGKSEIDTPDAFAAAHHVGRLFGENGLTMLYDGSPVGPIATVAETTLATGGRVVAVLPEAAATIEGLTERRRAETADEFQQVIAEMADAYLGLPGGFPSLEAALGSWDWSTTARTRPIGLLDLGRYYSELMKHAPDHTLDRFVRESQRGQLVVSMEAADLLRRLDEFRPPESRRSGDGDDD